MFSCPEVVMKTIKRLYKRTPRVIQLILLPTFWMYHTVRNTYAVLRPCVWVLKSVPSQDIGPGSLLFCGEERDKNYIIRMTFNRDCTQTSMGRQWVWQIISMMRSRDCRPDLLMYDVPLGLSGLLGCRRCFCLPLWAHGDLDTSLIDLKSSNLKNDIRRIRNKYAYTFEVTTDLAGLRFFYDTMYVPYARAQFGEELLLDDFEDLLASKNAEVLWILKDGVRVAGACFYYRGGKAVLRSLGVQNGDKELVKSGAIQAIYYFTTNYLKEKGCNRADVAGSRPFFSDGVLNYKKKWGLCLTHCQTNVMRVYPLRDTSWVRAFLVNNPCIALETNELVGMVFSDKKGPLTDEDIGGCSRYLWPGLKRVVLYVFDDAGAVARTMPAQCAGMVVRPAEELFR